MIYFSSVLFRVKQFEIHSKHDCSINEQYQ